MTEIIDGLAALHGRYDALLCDLWGCFHNGLRPHDAAVDALRAWRAAGGTVAMFTNAPRPDFTVAKQLAGMGAPSDCWDLIVSSGDATRVAVATGAYGRRCVHIGAEKDLDVFHALDVARGPLGEADFVFCTGFADDRTETPQDYRPLLEGARTRDLPFVCANPDIVVDKGNTRLWCAGALARDYEALGGAAHSFGKPHLPIYDLALDRLAELRGAPLDKARVLAIGDGPITDVKGANAAGIDSVFVAGGLSAQELLSAGALKQSEVEALLQRHDVTATYAIDFCR